ncbi:MAG: hypothetical protein ABIH04_07125 [Planctomycetota bacterium]
MLTLAMEQFLVTVTKNTKYLKERIIFPPRRNVNASNQRAERQGGNYSRQVGQQASRRGKTLEPRIHTNKHKLKGAKGQRDKAKTDRRPETTDIH